LRRTMRPLQRRLPLIGGQAFKTRRTAALAEWRQFFAA
jgi:hypothetical protein